MRALRTVAGFTLIELITVLILVGILAVTVASFFFGGNRNPIAGIAIMILAPLAASLVQMAISRAREYEADRIGMQTLNNAKFDPAAMAGFFERLQKHNRLEESNAPEFLRTHPVTSERMSEAQGRALSLPSRMPADSTEFLLAREKARLSRLDPQAAISFYTDALKDGRYLSEMAQWYGLAGAQLKRNDLAGKTGTTNDYLDAWFCGYQPTLVTVAWIGFDKPRNLGSGETGGHAALPMWINYMRKALEGVPESFPKAPEGLIRIQPAGSATEEMIYKENLPDVPAEAPAEAKPSTPADEAPPPAPAPAAAPAPVAPGLPPSTG